MTCETPEVQYVSPVVSQLNPGVMSMTKSQSQAVVACWAAWTPADATGTYHHVELSLCGGAAPNPGQTLVFVGSDEKENQVQLNAMNGPVICGLA